MVSSNDSLKMEPWPRREMSLCSRELARTASFLVGAASTSEWMTFIRSAARRSYERERVDLTVRRTDHIPLAHARSYDVFPTVRIRLIASCGGRLRHLGSTAARSFRDSTPPSFSPAPRVSPDSSH